MQQLEQRLVQQQERQRQQLVQVLVQQLEQVQVLERLLSCRKQPG